MWSLKEKENLLQEKMKKYDLELVGTRIPKKVLSLQRCIAVGMLVAEIIFFALLYFVVFTNTKDIKLLSFFILNGDYRSSDSLPNAFTAGGWVLSPFSLIFLCLG